MVAYLTERDGPLQQPWTERSAPLPSLHERLLRKAAERLEVVDAYMRARVAFLVSGKDRGYYAPQVELDLAGATLDSARTAAAVVDVLLEGRLPTPQAYRRDGRHRATRHTGSPGSRRGEAPTGP